MGTRLFTSQPAVRGLLRFSFTAGVVLGLLGSVISFAPGAEVWWFLTVAVLSVSGFFIPKLMFRIAAALMLVIALAAAIDGCRRGIAYRRYLSIPEDQRTSKPNPPPSPSR